MRKHVPMRGECSGHLVDLNFTFDHNFLIRRFRRALRRDLIEDSFLFKAAGKVYPQQCRVSCYLFLPEYVTLDARKLADYLLELFYQSKRFHAENVKAKAT